MFKKKVNKRDDCNKSTNQKLRRKKVVVLSNDIFVIIIKYDRLTIIILERTKRWYVVADTFRKIFYGLLKEKYFNVVIEF